MVDEGVAKIQLGRAPGDRPAKDPVCNMLVSRAHPPGGSIDHGGTTWFFCNPRCREKFEANPERFLDGPPPPLLNSAPITSAIAVPG